MAAPYAPSQLSLSNFDATQAATATWTFSSSDTTVTQKSFQIKIFNNSTGVLVLDTGVVTNSNWQYTIPANTLVNRTQYKWQIQYTDSANNVSPWSATQVFTCSSLPVVSMSSPTVSQTISSNVVTVQITYSQSQSVAEQSYQIILYSSDQTTVVKDSGVTYNTANQYTISGLSNGTYYAQAIVTSSDGLQSSTGKVLFTVAYSGSAQSPSITHTPLPSSASARIDWNVPKSVPGTYVGSGAIYKTGKWNQAIQVAALGEKVYWTIASPFSEFTYTNWFITNVASSAMSNNQIFVKMMSDSNNYLQLRFDPVSQCFVFEKCLNGSVITKKNVAPTTPISFAVGAQIFVSIKQTNGVSTAYIGVGGNFYTINFGANTAPSSNTYGQGVYGTASHSSNVTGAPNLRTVYIGCSDVDGNEANALFDQTHLTTTIMSDTDIQSLYTNSTLQQYTFQSLFLANFDGTLEGGTGNSTAIDHWNIYRTYNGIEKLLGTVNGTTQNTASYTDTTPLSVVSYQYKVTPVDVNGNKGSSQTVTGSVSFDGWWLTDTNSGSSFQFLANLGEVPIKTNYRRNQFETFGTYPIVVYAPVRYRSGKLSGFIANNLNGASDPYSQYQILQSMIDTHHQLLLRNNTGWGMIVDCYDPTDTLPSDIPDQYNKVEISWTEVASA